MSILSSGCAETAESSRALFYQILRSRELREEFTNDPTAFLSRYTVIPEDEVRKIIETITKEPGGEELLKFDERLVLNSSPG